jgi:hypothetical protein
VEYATESVDVAWRMLLDALAGASYDEIARRSQPDEDRSRPDRL